MTACLRKTLFVVLVCLFLQQQAFGVFQSIERENHPVVSLNGTWEIYTVPVGNDKDSFDSTKPRENITFPQYDMRLGPNATGKDLLPLNNSCYWLVKTINVPADYAGKSVFLVFRFASFSIEAFVNDKAVGQFAGITTPVQMDITKHIKPGQPNTIRIKMRDWRVAIKPGSSFVSIPRYGYRPKPAGSITYPVNMLFTDHCVGIHDDVYIVAVNDVYVDDVFVKTSTRKKTLDADMTVKNLSSQPRRITLRSGVYERSSGDRVLSFDEKTITLKPSEQRVVTVTKNKTNLKYWHPNDPYMYDFKAEVIEKNALVDTKKQRFGFREVWTQGPKLMLNGYPVKLFQLGTFMSSRNWYDIDRTKNIAKIRTFYRKHVLNKGLNCIRWTGGNVPGIYNDIADEMGVMIAVEPDTTHCFGADFLSDIFWERVYANCEGFVKLYRNNPSVVVYSAGNETLIMSYHVKKSELDYALNKYFHIQTLFHKLDPTRPVMFEGNGGLGGRGVDIYNNHAYEAENAREWPVYSFLGSRLNIEYHANPETDFWGGKKVELADKPWRKDKPMILGEMFSMYKLPVECFSYIGGEEIYRNMFTDISNYYQAAGDLLVNLIAGYRYRDVAGMDPWYIFPLNDVTPIMISSQQKAYKLVSFYVYDKFCRYFPDRDVTKKIVCFNDAYDARPAAIVFQWTLSGGDKVIDKGTKDMGQVAAGSSSMVDINFHTPKRTGEYTLTLKMIRNGRQTHEDKIPIRIYPDLSKVKCDVKTVRPVCYDTKGLTAKVLKNIAPEVEVIKSPLPDKARKVLIIGEGSYDKACEAGSRELLRWVADGGRMLVLGQNYMRAPFNLDFAIDQGDTYTAFIRSKKHPVFAGLRKDDVFTWSDKFTVGYNSFRKFAKTSFRSLADNGYGHESLVFSVMTEQTLGKGRIIYCQFRIIERYQKEPAAQRLLKNTIEYLCSDPQPPRKNLYVVSKERVYKELFSKFGVNIEEPSKSRLDNAAGGVLWIDGSDAKTAGWLGQNNKQVKHFVSVGGSLFVDNLQKASLEAFNRCFEKKLKLTESKLHIPHLEYGPGENEKILWGLSLFDFTWDSYVPPFRTEHIVKNTIVPSSCDATMTALLVEPAKIGYRRHSWCKYSSLNPRSPQNKLNPDAGYSLVKCSYGKGNVYVSMLQLSKGFNGGERKKSERILSALLNNLNVGMDLNKIDFELVFPVKMGRFVPFGLARGGSGGGDNWTKCFKKDRVRWQIPGLKQKKYRISFKTASGDSRSTSIHWKIFLDGKEIPYKPKMKGIRSVLKGTNSAWEFFGGDLFARDIYTLNENSIIEIEAKGSHLLVYNLTLYPERESKY